MTRTGQRSRATGPNSAHLALLGKQRDVRPEGWREAAGEFGEEGSHRSIADVTSAEALLEVRAFKKAQKPAAKES